MNTLKDKVVITGAFGFVGCNIAQNLNLINDLIAVDIVKKENKHYHDFYSWQHLEKLKLNNINTFIHLAGIAHDTNKVSSQQEYFDVNVGLTQLIFQYFLKSSATKFIYFSSVKAVADSVIGDILTEETPPLPLTPYGKSKLAAEKYIVNELEKWKDEELKCGRNNKSKKVYILRPCMIHGPGNKGNLNLLYKLAKKGLPWPLGAFENRRSFTSIDNLLFVIKTLIGKNIEPCIYQISDDETLSTNELISLIAESLSREAHIWNISPGIIKLMFKTGDMMGLPLNCEKLNKLTESYVVSNQKIKKALGIEKMPCTASEGMKKTFASFLVY